MKELANVPENGNHRNECSSIDLYMPHNALEDGDIDYNNISRQVFLLLSIVGQNPYHHMVVH
jgi:hypothetical protein